MLSRNGGSTGLGTDPSAEVLAFGVLPQYRDREFVNRTGIRLSQDLIQHAIAYFRSHGMRELRAMVEDSNRPTLVFYRMLGATLERRTQAGEQMRWIRLPLDPE